MFVLAVVAAQVLAYRELKGKTEGLYGEVEQIEFVGPPALSPDAMLQFPPNPLGFFVELAVYNTGNPTLAAGYALHVSYEGYDHKWAMPIRVPPEGMNVLDDKGKLAMKLLPSDSLDSKTGAATPIQTGGGQDGWLVFVMGGADPVKIERSGVTCEISWFDIHKHRYYASRTFRPGEFGLRPTIAFPSMAPFERIVPSPEAPNKQLTPAPPSIAPTAQVSLEKFASRYDAHGVVNGVPVAMNLLELPGKPISVNFYFINTGTATADRVKGAARLYLVTDETEQSLTRKFTKFWVAKTAQLGDGTLTNTGHDEFWFTGESERVVSTNDLNKLSDGTARIYMFVAVTYDDPSGSHYVHICRMTQAPDKGVTSLGPVVWQYCKDFSDHR